MEERDREVFPLKERAVLRQGEREREGGLKFDLGEILDAKFWIRLPCSEKTSLSAVGIWTVQI